jgi:hypothetical protein
VCAHALEVAGERVAEHRDRLLASGARGGQARQLGHVEQEAAIGLALQRVLELAWLGHPRKHRSTAIDLQAASSLADRRSTVRTFVALDVHAAATVAAVFDV